MFNHFHYHIGIFCKLELFNTTYALKSSEARYCIPINKQIYYIDKYKYLYDPIWKLLVKYKNPDSDL